MNPKTFQYGRWWYVGDTSKGEMPIWKPLGETLQLQAGDRVIAGENWAEVLDEIDKAGFSWNLLENGFEVVA